MGRKNIFDILSEFVDFEKEIFRIDTLFSKKLVIQSFYNSNVKYTIEEMVDTHCFYDWKQRNRCLSTSEMRDTLGIRAISEKSFLTQNDILNYIEYVYNIFWLGYSYIQRTSGFKLESNAVMIIDNIYFLIDTLNQKWVYDEETEKGILVEDNASATSAAEISDTNTGFEILHYNHYALRGNLAEKKKILLHIAGKTEPTLKAQRKQNSSIAENTDFLLNNLNIRHNNIEPESKDYKELVAKMTSDELEEWYDETYQMLLLCILEKDNETRIQKAKELKAKIASEK